MPKQKGERRWERNCCDSTALSSGIPRSMRGQKSMQMNWEPSRSPSSSNYYEQPVHSIAVECAERVGRRLSPHSFIRGRLCAQHHSSRSCARLHQLLAWVQLNAFSNVGESRSGKSYLTTPPYNRGGWSRLQLSSGSDMLVALSAAVSVDNGRAAV